MTAIVTASPQATTTTTTPQIGAPPALVAPDQFEAAVSGIYGPGAVIGWLLSCLSFLVTLASPRSKDTINNDFLVAVTYPAVVAGDLLLNNVRYWQVWRICKGWWDMHFAVRNGIGGGLEVWREWLLMGFGPVLAAKYSCGLPHEPLTLAAAAFPYMAAASVRVLKLSLLFFSIFFVLARQVCPADRKRSTMSLVIAWLVSFVLWWHLYGSGEDFSMRVDFYCLLPQPYRRNHYCLRTVLASGVFPGPKPECLKWDIQLRFSDIISIALLLLSYVTLSYSTENILPAPSTAMIRSRRRLRGLFSAFITSADRPRYISIPTIALALFNLTALLIFRAASTPILMPLTVESLRHVYPPGVERVYSVASNTYWLYHMSCGTIPATTYKLSDLDQALAVFAGASAAGLSLKDVIKERKFYARIREWLHRNCRRLKQGSNTSSGHLDESTGTLELSSLHPARLRRRGEPNISQNF